MPKTYICPFWKWDKRGVLGCEGGRMRFPDDRAKRDYAKQFCASLAGWQHCSIAGSLVLFYERKQDGA